jgi:hypothetical protein
VQDDMKKKGSEELKLEFIPEGHQKIGTEGPKLQRHNNNDDRNGRTRQHQKGKKL